MQYFKVSLTSIFAKQLVMATKLMTLLSLFIAHQAHGYPRFKDLMTIFFICLLKPP